MFPCELAPCCATSRYTLDGLHGLVRTKNEMKDSEGTEMDVDIQAGGLAVESILA